MYPFLYANEDYECFGPAIRRMGSRAPQREISNYLYPPKKWNISFRAPPLPPPPLKGRWCNIVGSRAIRHTDEPVAATPFQFRCRTVYVFWQDVSNLAWGCTKLQWREKQILEASAQDACLHFECPHMFRVPKVVTYLSHRTWSSKGALQVQDHQEVQDHRTRVYYSIFVNNLIMCHHSLWCKD